MTLRIHVLPETPREGPLWACAEIRLISPLTHPSVAKWVTTTYSVDATLPSGRLDVVSIQRAGVPGFKLSDAVSLVKAIRDRGAKIVYDIDDDLLCPPPIMAIEAKLASDRLVTRFLAREADLITCSTDQMAIRMAPFPAPKKVWRNAINEQLLTHKHLRAAHKDQIRALVGYAGTATHFRDLLSVTESLRRALSDRADTVGLDFSVPLIKPIFGLCLGRFYLQTQNRLWGIWPIFKRCSPVFSGLSQWPRCCPMISTSPNQTSSFWNTAFSGFRGSTASLMPIVWSGTTKRG